MNIINKRKISIETLLQWSINLFVFLLPWHTIWIYNEYILNGAKLEYATLGFYATEFLLWMLLVFFFFWYWKKRGSQIRKNEFYLTKDRMFILSVFIFLLYIFFSVFWSINVDVAQQQALRIMEAALLFLFLLIGPIDLQKIMRWFVFGAVVQGVLGIWQFISQSTFVSTILGTSSHVVAEPGTAVVAGNAIGRVLRAYGGFTHPNVFGGFLVIAIILFLLMFLKNKKNHLLSNICYFILLISLFFTFSRSAWLALLVCFVGLLIMYGKKFLRPIIIGVGVFVILTLLYLPIVQTRFFPDSRLEIKSVEERISGYEESFALIKNNPLVGVGIGNYSLALAINHPGLPGWAYQPVHNVGFLLLAEVGVIGIVLLCGVIYSWLSLSGFSKEIFLFAIIYLVLGTFDHYLFSSYIGLMLSAIYWGIVIRMLPQLVHT